jgi:hypothetical protein
VSAALVDSLTILQRDHYKKGGWAYNNWRGSPGQWTCGCGASGVVLRDESVTTHHRRHVAEVIAQLVAYTNGESA